jgi:hypothetical protein
MRRFWEQVANLSELEIGDEVMDIGCSMHEQPTVHRGILLRFDEEVVIERADGPTPVEPAWLLHGPDTCGDQHWITADDVEYREVWVSREVDEEKEDDEYAPLSDGP